MTEIANHDSGEGHDVPVPLLKRRRQIQLVGIIMLAVLVLFLGGPWVSRLLVPPPAPTAPPPGDGSFVATVKEWATLRFEMVHRQTFQNAVTTDGKIATDDDLTTPVFSPFTGRVTRVFVKAGDAVRPGSPLFAVIANEAAQSDADILTATAQLNAARANEARQRDLSQHQGAAVKDWQQAQVDLATAQAALAAARTRRGALGGGISHGEAVVRAPVAGVITQRLIGVGQNVASAAGGGATQAFAISDFARVWVVGNLREEDAMSAHVGQEALVRLLAAPGQPIHARVDYVALTLDPLSRRLTVRASLANPGGRLKPEMYASFSLLTGGARTALSVPTSAVIYEGSTARVWLARGKDRHLALREVAAGATVDGRVEILSGLSDGDRVVTAGALFIDRGAKAD
ncbi:MAG TPA: efflux RND transporter periplasmic adaptor subunit [Sphingomonas sp.]|nr:efflux RND transporter periplasmic adaptor subunit [Sphingomonas sp.]